MHAEGEFAAVSHRAPAAKRGWTTAQNPRDPHDQPFLCLSAAHGPPASLVHHPDLVGQLHALVEVEGEGGASLPLPGARIRSSMKPLPVSSRFHFPGMSVILPIAREAEEPPPPSGTGRGPARIPPEVYRQTSGRES